MNAIWKGNGLKNIKRLSLSRKKWLESSQDNGFDQGLLKLLTELYPDKAHFIYELLQNAEDAQASSVSFILHKDYLEFIHDGIMDKKQERLIHL